MSEILTELENEMGVIAEETCITGNVSTKGHLTVSGKVLGDISAKGNVIITGNVRGRIACNNLMLENCSLDTQIHVTGSVVIKEGVKITGDITGTDITVMGSVNGNIAASGKVELSERAAVKGDIVAAAIGVAVGAKLDGSVSIK